MKRLASIAAVLAALVIPATANAMGNGESKTISVSAGCGSKTYSVKLTASWPAKYDYDADHDGGLPYWYVWPYTKPHCEDGKIWVRFHYADFPEQEITGVTQRMVVGDRSKTKTGVDFHGSGGDDEMLIRRPSNPPPPPKLATKASIHGPCGDPMFWSTFNNKGSDVRARFLFSYVAFSDGERHAYRHRVAKGHVFTTPLFHVLGFTMMRVWAHGELLAKERAAAPGNYAPCP